MTSQIPDGSPWRIPDGSRRLQQGQRRHPSDAERGAAALASAGMVVFILIAVLLAGMPILQSTLAVHRARAAADLTALAVLGGSRLAGGPGSPDLQGGRAVAAANGAELTAVDVAGWPLGVHVHVLVKAPTPIGTWAFSASGAAALRLPDGAARPALTGDLSMRQTTLGLRLR